MFTSLHQNLCTFSHLVCFFLCICFSCCQELSAEVPKTRKPNVRQVLGLKLSWKENSNAERIFNLLPEKDTWSYSALIRGMVKVWPCLWVGIYSCKCDGDWDYICFSLAWSQRKGFRLIHRPVKQPTSWWVNAVVMNKYEFSLTCEWKQMSSS